MTCLEAQENMIAFIRNQMDIEKTEAFINHVKVCPDCREELEVTHVLSSALWQLDNDADFKGDYIVELERHLNQVEAKIKRYHKRKVVNRILLPVLLIIILFLTGYYKPEDDTTQRDETGMQKPTGYIDTVTGGGIYETPGQ